MKEKYFKCKPVDSIVYFVPSNIHPCGRASSVHFGLLNHLLQLWVLSGPQQQPLHGLYHPQIGLNVCPQVSVRVHRDFVGHRQHNIAKVFFSSTVLPVWSHVEVVHRIEIIIIVPCAVSCLQREGT